MNNTQMQKTETLTVIFDLPLYSREISVFRKGITTIVSRSNLLSEDEKKMFHNHQSEYENIYRYPVVHYRVKRFSGNNNERRGDNHLASLTGINKGCDIIKKLLIENNGTITMHGKKHPLKVIDIKEQQYEIEETEKPITYKLLKWLAFDPENYALWRKARGMKERIGILETILEKHISTYCIAMGFMLEELPPVNIDYIYKMEQVKVHDTRLLAFDIDYSISLKLPSGISIGRSVSLGFGHQYPLNNNNIKNTKF